MATIKVKLRVSSTMLFNGKDKLQRKCRHCGAVISAHMGAEKHIALVGVAESGKTTLVYRFIAELLRKYPKQVNFTDEVDWNMAEDIKQITAAGSMQEFPSKTAVGVMRSIQLRIERGMNMSYRLFINDVGGELYSMSTVDGESAKEIAQFVRNVNTILFLVDPMTTDFSECDLSDEFADWLKKNQKGAIQKVNIADAFRRLVHLLESQKLSKKYLARINFNVILVKKDLNYLSNIDSADEAALKGFIQSDMGLPGLISDIESTFDKERIRFISMAAVGKNEEDTHISKLSDVILTQLDINALKDK